MNRELMAILVDDVVNNVVMPQELDDALERCERYVGKKRTITVKPVTDIIKAPDTDIEQQVNELWPAVRRFDEVYMKNGLLAIDIQNGDWKHDHLFADFIIREVFGGERFSEVITEDNGDDVYSSTHYYKIKEAEEL